MAHFTEDLFEDYLKNNNIEYQRDIKLNNHEIDFEIYFEDDRILCELKSIDESLNPPYIGETVKKRLQSDIRNFRRKIGNININCPTLLVTINNSDNGYSSYSLFTAMLGDAGIELDRITFETTQDLRHLPRGHASMTPVHNTLISGIFQFNPINNKNYIFHNCYSKFPLPKNIFKDVKEIIVDNQILQIENIRDIYFFSIKS